MRKSRLKKEKIEAMVDYFVAGTPARTISELCEINRKTVNNWYFKFRKIINEKLNENNFQLDGKVELDESYFGGVRKGKRGRGAADKIIVFGLYKRNSYVYAEIVENTRSLELFPIIKRKVKPHSVVYTDSYRSYNILDVSEFQHFRIDHSKKFVEEKNHINGIENFWNQAKRHLRRYNGIPKKHFNLYLKECEWRFNYPNPKEQIMLLKYWIQGKLF